MPNHEVPAYNRSSVYKVEHILSHTVCQRGQMGEKQPRPMWRVPLWDMTWVPCGPCGTWPGTLWCGLRGARHDQTDYRSCTMPSYVGAVCVQRGRVEGSHCFGGREPQPLIAQHARSQLDPGKSFNGKWCFGSFHSTWSSWKLWFDCMEKSNCSSISVLP